MTTSRIVRYEILGDVHFGLIEERAIRRLAGAPYQSAEPTDIMDPLDAATLLCPVPAPRIFGAGMNYVAHIREMGHGMPEIPVMFMKPSTAAIGPGDAIVYPREGRNVHFEGELAVVIGRGGRRIREEDALDHVLGYTCANDVSERVIQSKEMAMGCLLVGKAFDTFCPLGPWIVTGLDPRDLALEARVNGEVRQSSSTADLLFSVSRLIAHLSDAVTLLPGDVILTGTPAGVGPIKPGDRIDVSIAGIGTLSNPVVAEEEAF
jgi:2-keto-4-pentenoate hydratase/2-oxohepta-3-ene-1,7-dioic acid hydratase in catechol pathway